MNSSSLPQGSSTAVPPAGTLYKTANSRPAHYVTSATTKVQHAVAAANVERRGSSPLQSLQYATHVYASLQQRSESLGNTFLTKFANGLFSAGKANTDPIRRAADMALQSMCSEGAISAAEAKQIKQQASDTTAGSEGIEGTPSSNVSAENKATNSSESPQRSAGVHTRGASAGQHAASPSAARNSATTSKGNTPTERTDAPRGFLWKPTSASDSNLVVLLPADWAKSAKIVELVGPDGEVLGTGTFKALFEGDGRPIYRFEQSGSAYPPGVSVRITFTDGTQSSIQIKDPSSRLEAK